MAEADELWRAADRVVILFFDGSDGGAGIRDLTHRKSKPFFLASSDTNSAGTPIELFGDCLLEARLRRM